jgi:hypothetical protein
MVNESCGCNELGETLIRRDAQMLRVCFGCGGEVFRQGGLPIYDARRKVRFTNVGPLVAVDMVDAWFCRRCYVRLLCVRSLRWFVSPLLLLIAFLDLNGRLLLIVPAVFLGAFGPVALVGRLFPSVARIMPGWIAFRGVPEQFRNQLPSCDELRVPMDRHLDL